MWALVRLRVAMSVSLKLTTGRPGRGGHVVEEHVHAVELILEAQVAHARAVAVVGADRHVQARLLVANAVPN